MKKMIWLYLDEFHPLLYRVETKFGSSIYKDGVPFSLLCLSENICNLFCCDRQYARDIILEWYSCRPIVKKIPNSTNEDVLISSLSNSDNNTVLF